MDNMDRIRIPEEYRPIGAWGYVGYSLLFSIPIVGFVFLIVFSCSGANLNRRSYARSYWCWLLLAAIIIAVLFALGVISSDMLESLRN